MGILMVVCWLLIATGLCIAGNYYDNTALLGVGAVMVVMTTMVYAVAW